MSIDQLELIAHKRVFVEIGKRDGCELDSSKFDEDQMALLAYSGYVAEIAEQVVDLSDLQIANRLEEENRTTSI